jgi:hypothetical protein
MPISTLKAKGRRGLRIAPLLIGLTALLLLAPAASATQFQRPLLETFGSAAQPSFEQPASIAVDQASGDVLVGDAGPSTISRLKANGEPEPFAALGTNVIDGKAGPGGLPCAEEPASCDKTPQDGISFNTGGNFPSLQIAVDPTNGNIYFVQTANNLVDIFSPEGRYLGQLTQAGTKLAQPCGVAFDSDGAVYIAQNNKVSKYIPTANPPVNANFKVNFGLSGAAKGALCRMAPGSGSSAGFLFITNNGEGSGRVLKVNMATGAYSVFAEGYESLVAVDPTSGNPVAFNTGEVQSNRFAELVEFDGSLEEAELPLSRLMVEDPQLAALRDYSFDSAGKVYVAYNLFGSDPQSIRVYGQPGVAPTVFAEPASDVGSRGATLNGSVNAEGVAVTECFFEWGPPSSPFSNGVPQWQNKTPCEDPLPPTDFADHPVQAAISGLAPNGAKYFYRLAVRNENGTERSAVRSLNTGSSAETNPATAIGLSTATLNGLVHPEGHQYEECFFEWGIATNVGFEHTTPCVPSAGGIPPDSGEHAVSADLTGLQEATAYRFRLMAKNNGTPQVAPVLSFETFGPPRIAAVRASDATEGAATLEAEIVPRGTPTSYRFEWGPTESYGHIAPAAFEPIGSGTSQVKVSTQISGLASASTYHYRVVASGGAGTVQGADHELETLNSCGLPDGRCLELVSPRDPGPVALPLENIAQFQLAFQAAEAPGALAYEVELGFTGANAGGETVYLGSRDSNGWESAQINPSMVGPGEGGGVRYALLGLSPNLDCGVVASKFPLTSDPVAKQTIEAGVANLYRRGSNGSYTLITNLPPEELKGNGEIIQEFSLAGMSEDCEHVVFKTERNYAGVPGAGDWRFYEWDEGTLRNIGWVPSGSGEAVAEAGVGGRSNTYNAVSDDGSRVFFTATSKTGNDSGNQAVFVRIDGTETLDVSQSPLAQTAHAIYQGATPDGSRVYFTANAGLTAESNAAGRDLYECHIVEGGSGPKCELTDLSVNSEPGGVAEAGARTSLEGGSPSGLEVSALVGLADDGSRVYFIARGQLLPGRGRSLAANEAAKSYSLYAYEAASGTVEYVGAVREGRHNEIPYVTTGNPETYTSRASADGRYLLFESRENLTGYESGDRPMAYLYDAEAANGEGTLVCVSCRQDGKPTLSPDPLIGPSLRPLTYSGRTNPHHQPQSLVLRDGKPLVFFRSLDGLASGGVEGEWGLYEWAHSQVFNVASDLPGAVAPDGTGPTLSFLGASADGTDLYFLDPAALNWENPDARRSVWDARVGGGFPEPAPTFGCDPTAEGSCQGQGAPPPSTPSAGTATFSGPGNVKPNKSKKKQRKARNRKRGNKHQRKGRHGKSNRKKQKNRRARHVSAERRAAK